jgi:hypothetical protein
MKDMTDDELLAAIDSAMKIVWKRFNPDPAEAGRRQA